MKLLLLLILSTTLFAQPIHHQFKDYMIDEGYVDNFSLYHAGIGGIKGVACNIGERVANRYGYDYPDSFTLLGINLALAVAWEIAEFAIEGSFDNEKYQAMYNGKAWQNNTFDVILDMLVFSVPLWDDIYYDIIRHKQGFILRLEMKI